jgi:Zn-dependent protease with chaperone function
MRALFRKAITLGLCELLIFMPPLGEKIRRIAAGGEPPARAARPIETLSLRDYLQMPYLELFDVAPKLEFSAEEIQNQRKAFEKGKSLCVLQFKDHAKQYSKQMDAAQKSLKEKTATLTDSERNQMHCQIQNLELLKSEAQALAGHAIPTAYDNLNAKLDLIEKWPALKKQATQDLVDGSYMKRRFGDVKDIGFRQIEPNQEADIKKGQQAIEELKRQRLLPPELDDKAIQDYVNTIAQNIAAHSDLMVPLHVTVLQSREINAFALPGGYVFVERGLLEATDNEAELAGVMAHEMSHVIARHGNKLMQKALMTSILYQAAQIAAVVLTGGAGIGVYYALQYGFYGLAFVLDLNLLGVSREFELQADQLGAQYAWNAGYDPTGFIEFFDKMATREGYVNSTSWFRTHPPFFERMVTIEREISFLPSKPDEILQTSAFEDMKKRLAPISVKAEKEEVGRPSLLKNRLEGCEPPKKLEYKPSQPIEQICALPAVTVSRLNETGVNRSLRASAVVAVVAVHNLSEPCTDSGSQVSERRNVAGSCRTSGSGLPAR